MNKDFEIEALSNRKRLQLYINIYDLLETNNYINNCDQLLDEVKKTFPDHYKVENVRLN